MITSLAASDSPRFIFWLLWPLISKIFVVPQWKRAALDGEVIPLKLVSPDGGFLGFSLKHFAFRKEDIEAYVDRRGPAIQIPPSQTVPEKRKMIVSEMADLLMC